MAVHVFSTDLDSSSVYDLTQTSDSIVDGDILIVLSEGVVGFLNEAWPIAVTEPHGQFHVLKPDFASQPPFADRIAEATDTYARYQADPAQFPLFDA